MQSSPGEFVVHIDTMHGHGHDPALIVAAQDVNRMKSGPWIWHWITIATAVCISGCQTLTGRRTPESSAGYVIVLPGIEGKSIFNLSVAHGLSKARPDMTVEVDDWTTGFAPLLLLHLRGDERNRREARRLASKIVNYQDAHPGRPVYLVGHSGGGGMALLVLETLPADRPITGVFLLNAAVSRYYNLPPVLAKTEDGIWNYHSSNDVALLVAGTTLFGTHDGHHQPSAGAYGFLVPQAGSRHFNKLQQIPFDLSMIRTGNLSGHFGTTTSAFACEYIAPHLRPGIVR